MPVIAQKKRKRGNEHERGSAMVEFALCIALFWLPLCLGTIVIGLSLIRAIQVTEVCRDAGHMYAYGTDFTQISNQNIVTNQLAQGLNMSTNGVVILSTITYWNTATVGNQRCGNYQQAVFTQQIVIGNFSRTSAFGTPPTTNYNVTTADSCNNPAALATNLPANFVGPNGTQLAYVSEMYVNSPDLDLWSYLGTPIIAAENFF